MTKERPDMKRLALIMVAIFMAFSGFAQKQKYTEEDARHFYRAMQGDYTVIVNDTTTASAHFTPIWENTGNPYQWLYVEVTLDDKVILQKVLEVSPKNDKVFRVSVYNLKDPAQFVGKWGNCNYFDGFNSAILTGKKKMTFVKTNDYSYQSQWYRYGVIDAFPKGDLLHFKFVEQDERFYVKRMPTGTDRILGYQGIKESE